MRRGVEKRREVVGTRRVDRTGKGNLWGKAVRVGKRAAGPTVRIHFDGEGDEIRILGRDAWGRVREERVLE
ncbi:hypothetical protein [Thermoflexus sp.]|uniref:hypothetical protein n=1 Tax=Thermoflexus sp. TaxID=1969742 RepID=UPI0035E45410